MNEEIGSGSYGNVFKCKLTGDFPPLYHNTPQDSCSYDDNIQYVAIKRFTSLFKCPVDTKRCLREIVQLRHLLHPNIVNIRELFVRENKNPSFQTQNISTTLSTKALPQQTSHHQHPTQNQIKDVFMVMEFLDSDLRNVVKRRMTLKKKHIDSLMYHCTRALQQLHLRGVMHRDIKPNNILINEDCQAKLCDFGLARAVGANVYSNHDEQMVQQQTKKSMMDDMYSSPEHNDSISTNTHSRSPQDLDDCIGGSMSGSVNNNVNVNMNMNMFTQSKTQSQVKGLTSSHMGWNMNKNNSDMTDFLKNQNTTAYNCNVDSKAMVDTKMNTFLDTKAMVDVNTHKNNLTHHLVNQNVTYNQKDNFLNLNPNKNKGCPSQTDQLNSIYKLTPQVATRYQRAPELIIHNSYQDGRIDVWALGCVFAELLCLSNESTKSKCPVFPGNMSGNNQGYSIETIRHNLPCLGDWDRFNEKQKFNYEQLQRIFKLCGIPDDLKFIENTIWVDFFTQIRPHVKFEGFASQFAPTVSSDDISFLQTMLTVDPQKRATIHDIVDHKWFKSLISDPRFEKYERICFVVNKNAKLLDCNQTDDQKTQSVSELNSLFWNEQEESQKMVNLNGDIHQEWCFQKDRLNKANVN